MIDKDQQGIIKDDYGFETKKAKNWLNKQRTLVVSTKGVTSKERQILVDFMSIITHLKTDSKIERREIAEQLENLCELQNCENFMFFEGYQKETFLWIGKIDGPSVKYRIEKAVNAEDQKLFGNCLKNSRPLISFGNEFLQSLDKKIEKNLWVDILNVPKNHPKSQPFFDKMIQLNYIDNILFLRVFQIQKNDIKGQKIKLIEIGPRLNLSKVRILQGSYYGPTLFLNDKHVSRKQKRIKKNKQIKINQKKEKKRVLKKEKMHKELKEDQQKRKDSFEEFLKKSNQNQLTHQFFQKLQTFLMLSFTFYHELLFFFIFSLFNLTIIFTQFLFNMFITLLN